jgi:hypothetical protein
MVQPYSPGWTTLPYHGPNGRAKPETVADWVLGGVARRRVLERLAERGDGWTAAALASDLDLGRAWVFEVFRALRAIEVLESRGGGRYRFSPNSPIARSLRHLLTAVAAFDDVPVDRPPSRRR